MRDSEPDDVNRLELVDHVKKEIERVTASSVQMRFVSAEQGKLAIKVHNQAVDALVKLIEKEKSEEDRDYFTFVLVSLSLTSSIIGGQNPAFVSRVEKLLLRERVANSRKIKAARRLTREEVDEIICSCFDDKNITKISHSPIQKAGHALAHVNQRLAEKALALGLTPTHYTGADSLRRRYKAITARTAS